MKIFLIWQGKSVQFNEILVAETFVYEKYTRFEIMNLFYTHDDATKFQYDFECESQQAMKEGKSWIDYIS